MEKYNLYKLLNGCKDFAGNEIKGVTVPLIQREYAQGRLGKEELRQNILKQMKVAVDSIIAPGAPTLDYVYGRLNDEIFYPLDGQQRLTTLWLLHWYISFKAGMLKTDKEWLSRFSYQTRITSEEFCKALCEEMADVDPEDKKIKKYRTLSDFIKEQNWFYSSWLQDPTIVSMLRSLSGDANESDKRMEDFKDLKDTLKNAGKKDIYTNFLKKLDASEKDLCSQPTLFQYLIKQELFDDAWLDDPVFSTKIRQMGNDNIESIFGEYKDYSSIRNVLICDDSSLSFAIVFLSKVIEKEDNKNVQEVSPEEEDNKNVQEVPLEKEDNKNVQEVPLEEETCDDIYIKMNSTGKRLTDFENFKADWIAHLQKECPKEYSKYAGYMDNSWTDVFWKYIKGIKKDNFDGEIDIQYFQFINRFFLNRIIAETSEGSPEYVPASLFKTGSINQIKKYSAVSSFQQLYGKDQGQAVDDTKIGYNGFSYYSHYCNAEMMDDLNTVFSFLASNEKIVKDLNINLSSENGWTFLPGFELVDDKKNNTKVLKEKSTSQSERIYFHAVSQYIILSKKQEYIDSDYKVVDEDDFEKKYKWLIHIVRNLIINGDVSTIDSMVTGIRKIDGIVNGMSIHNMDVYEYLRSVTDPSDVDSKLEMQYREEVEKAKYLIGTDMDRRKKVLEAEELPFCVGTIRFLYTSKGGKIGDSKTTWSLFDTKLKNAEDWFEAKTLGEPVSKMVVKEFLKYFSDYSEVKGEVLLTKDCNEWKKILINPDYADKVHELLTTPPKQPSLSEPFPSEEIVKTIIEIYYEKNDKAYVFQDIEGLPSLHKKDSWHDYLIFDDAFSGNPRKAKCKVLHSLVEGKKVTVNNKEIDGYYYGDEIGITNISDGQTFLWIVKRGKDYIVEAKDNKIKKGGKEEVWNNPNDLETILAKFV